MTEKRDLFDFIIERTSAEAQRSGFQKPQAFIRWFIDMYWPQVKDPFISDGSKDGKVDAFFATHDGSTVKHHVINAKYTEGYNTSAPPSFYAEIAQFSAAFENANARNQYLEAWVRSELIARYRQLFSAYDDGRAELVFLTTHKLRDDKVAPLAPEVRVFGLNQLVQHVIDDIDGAMPITPPLTLHSIGTLLAADQADTEVSTSIAFARIVDFITYMNGDPFDLLFARNVRIALSRSKSAVNRAIYDTFRHNPREFAYSNNGITILCEKHRYDPGSKEVTLWNPRVVNGSQTLHSVRDVPNPSKNARVMVRIVEIPPPRPEDLPNDIQSRKRIITHIVQRSNQQNPMKKWSLVSNDDFQMELYRFFRQRGLFYERREGEWGQRSRELRTVGIERGPGIKRLAQLIASYYVDARGLGPAAAKLRVSALFEGQAYDDIQNATPELAFQLYLIQENIRDVYRELQTQAQYIGDMKGHIDLALFALVIQLLSAPKVDWGDPELTQIITAQWDEWERHYRAWHQLVKACCQRIRRIYREEAAKVRRGGRSELTLNNFFKSEGYVARVLALKDDRQLGQKARAVL